MALDIQRVTNKAHAQYWPNVKARLDLAGIPNDQQTTMKDENWFMFQAIMTALVHEITENAEVQAQLDVKQIVNALKGGTVVPQDGGATYKATVSGALPTSPSNKIK